jgi:putative flavoprotein involved in K+ transport
MDRVTTVIIGAGQNGLAMSRELSLRGIDHVVLERGEIANSWRKERWDELRLLSPNWQNDMPGRPYRGADPEGYMSAVDFAETLERFAADESVPVRTGVSVTRVGALGGGYVVETAASTIACESVVIATGACARTRMPNFASELPASVHQFTPLTYKRPADLPAGGVLVVGASASGVQIARDLRLAGRAVTLAVGAHTRLPRTYRGGDIMFWMDRLGLFDLAHTEVDDLERVRRTPSMQLMGGAEGSSVDLNALQDIGVEIAGRLAGIAGGLAQFSGSLANVCAAADLKLGRLLDAVDEWIETQGFTELVASPDRPAPTRLPAAPRLSLDFAREGVASVVWATGYAPDHGFLDLPVFDAKGRIRHDGGVVAPGLYVMGLPFLRRRKSIHIDGAGEDARDLADHLEASLAGRLAA